MNKPISSNFTFALLSLKYASEAQGRSDLAANKKSSPKDLVIAYCA